MQVTDAIFQAIELLHFFVAQHAVENSKIVHVSDVRRAQHPAAGLVGATW